MSEISSCLRVTIVGTTSNCAKGVQYTSTRREDQWSTLVLLHVVYAFITTCPPVWYQFIEFPRRGPEIFLSVDFSVSLSLLLHDFCDFGTPGERTSDLSVPYLSSCMMSVSPIHQERGPVICSTMWMRLTRSPSCSLLRSSTKKPPKSSHSWNTSWTASWKSVLYFISTLIYFKFNLPIFDSLVSCTGILEHSRGLGTE